MAPSILLTRCIYAFIRLWLKIMRGTYFPQPAEQLKFLCLPVSKRTMTSRSHMRICVYHDEGAYYFLTLTLCGAVAHDRVLPSGWNQPGPNGAHTYIHVRDGHVSWRAWFWERALQSILIFIETRTAAKLNSTEAWEEEEQRFPKVWRFLSFSLSLSLSL